MHKIIVIDTNILISALLFPESLPYRVLEKAKFGEYKIYVSNQTLDEFLKVAKRQKFVRYFLTLEKREELIKNITDLFVISEVTNKVTECRDPKDNKFLEIALSVGAKVIITGDKRDLISMNPFRGIEIITAREFLENY